MTDWCWSWGWFITILTIALVVYTTVDKLIRWPFISTVADKYVFITGCDTGFGHEIAKRLDSKGCHVIAACLTNDGEEGLKIACSPRLQTISLDVTDGQSVRRAYERVKEILPPGQGLWGVLNNAGILGLTGPVEWFEVNDYKQVIAVNLLGTVDVAVTFLPLVKQARGRIVNTASINGRYSPPLVAPYSISKYGVEAFSDTLRRELMDFSVSVHIVEPGVHRTPIASFKNIQRSYESAWNKAPEESKEEYGRAYIESYQENLQNLLENATSRCLRGVVDSYEHALFGMFPRARYVVGLDAKIIILIEYLPEWIGDFLLTRLMKLPKPKATL